MVLVDWVLGALSLTLSPQCFVDACLLDQGHFSSCTFHFQKKKNLLHLYSVMAVGPLRRIMVARLNVIKFC